jgi:SulP family sulfate permease
VKALVTHLDTIDLPTVALSVASLVGAAVVEPAGQALQGPGRLPGPLGVLVLATGANAILQLPVETIGSRFNGIPRTCRPSPCPSYPWKPWAS